MNQPNVSKSSTSKGQENPEKHQSSKVPLQSSNFNFLQVLFASI